MSVQAAPSTPLGRRRKEAHFPFRQRQGTLQTMALFIKTDVEQIATCRLCPNDADFTSFWRTDFDQTPIEAGRPRRTTAPDHPSFSCSIQPLAFSFPCCFSTDLSPWQPPLLCLRRPLLYLASYKLKSGFQTIVTLSLCADEHRARLRRHDLYGRYRSRARSGGIPAMPAITAPADVERHVRRVENSVRLFR